MSIAKHWLFAVNLGVGAFVFGALLAPVAATLGWSAVATGLYTIYHLTCHQWAFRSFFVFGDQLVYGRDQLQSLGLDPFTFVGAPAIGWKLAFCERDLSMYLALLLFGLVYAWRRLPPPSARLYALFLLPIAFDGFTQLVGWRESTWELRVATGTLFGLGSGWFVYPQFDAWLQRNG